MSGSQQVSSRPQVLFLVPHCEKLIGSWWQAGHGHLALTGSPAGGAQSHGGGSVAKPAQGGGPDVARLCSIEIQTKPQIQDHFLETPRLETGTHPEPHNSWSPCARKYVPCGKLYLGLIDWFLSGNQTITQRPKAFCSLLKIKRPSITDHASRLIPGVGTLGRMRFPCYLCAHGSPEAGAWHQQLRGDNAPPLLLGDSAHSLERNYILK